MLPAAPEFVYLCETSERLSATATPGGPLQGLTLGVKDLFDISGLPTAAGNPDWLATHPTPNSTAPVVQQLLAAGAQLVGKTLTDELAYSLNGVNIHYGTPLNPKAPTRLPGGSSSGSAVAVAKGVVDIGLGTDTGGSIRVPASYNGLYGLRPSHGLVSLEGCMPLAPRFDTAGWLTRDLATLAQVASVLLPPQTAQPMTELCLLLPEGLALWQPIAECLASALAGQFERVRVEILSAEMMATSSALFRTLQGYQIWQTHGSWVSEHQPHFADDIADRFAWCQTITAEQQAEAEQQAAQFCRDWRDRFLPNPDSLVILPSCPGAAPLLAMPAAALANYRNLLMGLTAPAGLLGSPQLSLPLLTDQNAPWGLSLLALPGADQALINTAQALQPLLTEVITN
ncbi:amidase [Halioxenophilus sp. WMMB6]|uniref:amidase n=1 Tax=Halioxenophilus sp. WMMB6 TaxID=3073815 RepID=UPI00295F486E|nr:amidase [Halioxenophilus sp. WMMB6]